MRGYSAIGLNRCKCKENLGGVLRAAGCYGASLVAVDGMRLGKYATDTQNAYKQIPSVNVESVKDCIPYKSKIVCIEITDKAKSLVNFRHPESAYYIFGPEDGSIDESIIEIADHVIQIPTSHCMNLAATANVVLYDRIAKQILQDLK